MTGQIVRRDSQFRGGPSDQNGNGVLELRALHTGGEKLGLGRGDLGIRGSHVAGRHRVTGFVLVVHDVVGLLAGSRE